MALLIIPIRVKEKMEVILQKDEGQGVSSPTILWNGATLKDSMYAVVVDNERVCETNDILLAYKVLFATHYVFNLAYKKEIDATMTFIQKGLLNVQDNCAFNRKVSNFLIEISTLS